MAAGWDCDGQAESAVCEDATQERPLLERFWRQSRGTTLVGFNCLSFDLPVLLRRSLYLGVRAPMLTLNKYRPGSIVDLMQRLAYQGTLTYRSLAFYCTRFGIVVPDDVTGADIGALVAAGGVEPRPRPRARRRGEDHRTRPARRRAHQRRPSPDDR